MACGCKKQKTAQTPAEQTATAKQAETDRLDAARRIEVARRAAERAAAQSA